jgi:acyl-CoA dehydrogenase
MRCTAKQDGDGWVINGQKTFISNGMLCDLCVVACRTETAKGEGHGGFSLFVVEDGTPGFVKLRKLDKIGMKSQDTAELLFEDCRVPAFNLLGEVGKGFYYLMEKLQQERLMVAIGAQAAAEQALGITIDYAKMRIAFGKPLTKFQALRFKMVEMATEITVSRSFVDNLIKAHAEHKNVAMETCMAKWWTTEMLKRVVDEGLQIHGGYGYMVEYPIAKAFVDARVQTIFAGTTEIMKEIVGRLMGL